MSRNGNGSAVKADPRKSVSEAMQSMVVIPPLRVRTIPITIRGLTPYVQHKFSIKAREEIRSRQEAGPTKVKAPKVAKDFQKCYREAMYISKEGWHGLPSPAFRNAMVSACRIVGYPMTRAKLALMVVADGFDAEDGTPLTRITKGEPTYSEMPVRLETGVIDLRARPMWREGWEAIVTIQFDATMFEDQNVVNLLQRAGQQVGIGEGRPDSRKSCGMGWGIFEIVANS